MMASAPPDNGGAFSLKSTRDRLHSSQFVETFRQCFWCTVRPRGFSCCPVRDTGSQTCPARQRRGFFIHCAEICRRESISRRSIIIARPGFEAASDQGGNRRALHVSRSSADLPNMQMDDAAGTRQGRGSSAPSPGLRMREVPHFDDLAARGRSKPGSGAREKDSRRLAPITGRPTSIAVKERLEDRLLSGSASAS
jgi:hypothetical protein